MKTDKELDFWAGQGGSRYMDRNLLSTAEVGKRTRAWGAILNQMNPLPESVLEVGCGPGANLVALNRLGIPRLFGLDPNTDARKMSKVGCPTCTVTDGNASAISAADDTFDMVFTAGVLIHINPERVKLAMEEIVRVSKKYVLAIEYFSPKTEPVQYYGADRIWRDDYGSKYAEMGLKYRASGFFWQPVTSFDNVVFWLFEK